MLITFGMDLDGSPWSHEAAALGKLQLGPLGLLSILETCLGLGGPAIHPARRIDQYLARLEASAGPREWFQRSLEADPWSTARHLLAWRDELVEAGWNGRAGREASPRLAGLARVEGKVELPLAPGRANRLQQVLDHLERGRGPGIERVLLLDPEPLLPPSWRRLFQRLADLGTKVEAAAPPEPVSRPESHLARIRHQLASGDRSPLVPSPGDESLLLLQADTEWDAAEAAALWLECELERREAAGDDETDPAAEEEADPAAAEEADPAAEEDAHPEDIAIICGPDTHLLDQALARRGLPTLERSSPSPWRDTLQLLPLALANVWHPVDVSLLAELLTHDASPVPRRAGRRLMRALSEEPGVGGPEWIQALDAIETAHKERLAQKGAADPARDAAHLRAQLDRRLATERFSPSEGVPAAVVVDRCQWVIDRLGPRAGSDPLAAAATAHATELKAQARRRDAEAATIDRVTLERILDSLVGTGEKAPDRIPRAAPWLTVRSPGQITRPVGTILWWGFTHGAASPATWWTDPELQALKEAGIELQPPGPRRKLEARGWRRPLECAASHLLLLHPQRVHGEVQDPHPLWDEIRSAAGIRPEDRDAETIEAALVRSCRSLERDGRWSLAGRARLVEPAPEAPVPEPTPRSRLETVLPETGGRTSFSQMSSLIGCPFQWGMGRAGLRGTRIQEIPTGRQVEGLLCHRIVEELLADPDRQWTPGEAADRANELYDELVGVMAAEMLLPGRELENRRLRRGIVDAVRALIEALDRHGLSVEATEESLERSVEAEAEEDEAPTGCTSVRGRADLVLRDADGDRYVLDLKWSGSSRYRREEVERGDALQLATYAWLLQGEAAEEEVQAGYFLLAQGELVTPAPGFGADALPSPRTLAQTWRRGVRSWNARHRDLMEEGLLEATGVQEKLAAVEQGARKEKIQKERREAAEAAGRLYIEPPCRFCDFGSLCGLAEVDS